MKVGSFLKLRSTLMRHMKNSLSQVVMCGANALQDHRNMDVVLSASLQGPNGMLRLRDPLAYVSFLRSCIEPAVFSVRQVKGERLLNNAGSHRFETLLDTLQSAVPPIEFSVAQEIGLIADWYLSLLQPVAWERWHGDIGLHFSISSSSGKKGRLLTSIIRFSQSKRCLELGTGYGISALFILAALKANGQGGHLSTLEGCEPQFFLASEVLKSRYPDMISCHFGTTQESLTRSFCALNGWDFLFHDAGHSREDYVRDFSSLYQNLVPGAVVVFDDIRWEDARFHAGPARTHEGWMEVVAQPRVKRAVEIDDSLGLLLLE